MTTPFLETPRFPDDLAFWARGGVSYNTNVASSSSGREQRNILWSYGRGQWDLQNTYRTNGGVADAYSIQTLRNFFRVAKGQAYGFRFRDWTDYLDEGGGILGAPLTTYIPFNAPTGTGSGVPVLQLYKEYAMSPLSDYRVIQKPLAASIYRNGIEVAAGTGPGEYALDTTTGLVTFVADSSESASSWTEGATTTFSVPAVPPGWASGKTLYFSGVAGDTAGVINNQAVAIQSVSGTSVTVAANTAGLTLSGGTASMYPQVTDELTWLGTFDTPCRFGTDQFAPQMDIGTGALWGFQTLAIVEIRLP
jgi:uncharacterized protein (TIGR02217 family)